MTAANAPGVINALRVFAQAAQDLADALDPLVIDPEVAATINRPTPDELCFRAAALFWYVNRAEIVGPSVRHNIVVVRHAIAYVLRGYGWTYARIGELLHRDHTTIISAVEAVAKWDGPIRMKYVGRLNRYIRTREEDDAEWAMSETT